MNLASRHRLTSNSVSLVFLGRLRWIAVLSQLTVIVAVRLFWFAQLPVVPLLALVAATALSNVVLTIYGPTSTHPGRWLRCVMFLDTALLTVLLALAGGASNPFSVLYTVHVALAAMLAGPIVTAIVVAQSILGFGLLFAYKVPLPPELGGHIHAGGAFSAHLQGMWLAFSATALTIGFFVTRLSTLLRKERDDHHRTARLLGLATLAAGAAHEIGNPLGTIKIAASEMKGALLASQGSQENIDDARLILAEVDRAQNAVQRLALGAGELMGELPASVRLGEIVRLLDSQYSIDIGRIALSCEDPDVRVRWPTQAVLHAVTQVLRNAIQASPPHEVVACRIKAQSSRVLFEVFDAGAGIPENVQDRIGEPFFTTREPGQGMGLGLFIARSLVEHLGGALKVESQPGRGTRVEIQIPLGAEV